MKVTPELPIKSVPLTVSVKAALPATAVAGFSAVMVGAGLGVITMKAVALVAVPLGVLTASRPEVAPVGITNESVVALTTVRLVIAAPFSVSMVAPVKSVPVTVTSVPTRPLAGVKLAMLGAGTVTTKASVAEVPPPGAGVVTTTS